MTKSFEEEFNYLIELSGKVLIGQVDAEVFEQNRITFFEKYETDKHQPLPEVPEFVAEYIETKLDQSKNLQDLYDESLFNTGEVYLSGSDNAFISWFNENTTLFEKAWTIGYTVQKPKRFYLKHIDMSKADKELDYYLAKEDDGTLSHDMPNKGQFPWHPESRFTQKEIDSMQTGSYEKIEVEK